MVEDIQKMEYYIDKWNGKHLNCHFLLPKKALKTKNSKLMNISNEYILARIDLFKSKKKKKHSDKFAVTC